MFTTEAPAEGFELRDDVTPVPLGEGRPEPKGSWIVSRQPIRYGERFPAHRRAPLAEEPELFRKLAALGDARDGEILGFADVWGFLTQPRWVLSPGEGPRPAHVGEALSTWRAAARTMRRLVDLWDVVSGTGTRGIPSESALVNRVVWTEGPPWEVFLLLGARRSEGLDARTVQEALSPDAIVQTITGGRRLVADEVHTIAADTESERVKNPEALAAWISAPDFDPHRPPLVPPAHFWLCQQVNAALRGNASPQVSPWTPGDMAVVPHNLLAAMYLQLANQVSGREPVGRRCKNCGLPFVPKRRDQQYCRPACRQMAFDKRKKEGGG